MALPSLPPAVPRGPWLALSTNPSTRTRPSVEVVERCSSLRKASSKTSKLYKKLEEKR
jgi:hypothetical protein